MVLLKLLVDLSTAQLIRKKHIQNQKPQFRDFEEL